MRLRSDVPDIIIPEPSLLAFEHNNSIEVNIPEAHNVQSGDIIPCKYGDASIIAEVVERKGKICVIKPMS